MAEYIIVAKGSWGMRFITRTKLRSQALSAISRAKTLPDVKSLIVRIDHKEFELPKIGRFTSDSVI